jgi:hypothetical protein
MMMLTNFSSRFLKAGSLQNSCSYFSSTSCKLGSGFLKGGTNFFLTEVPLGRTLAETNSPAGTTALAMAGNYGGLKACYFGAGL